MEPQFKRNVPKVINDVAKLLRTPLDPTRLKQVCCPVCGDLLQEPVRCTGTCGIVCCRRCAFFWRQTQGTCPRQCTILFNFSEIAEQIVQLKCPYNCSCQINKMSLFLEHLQLCPSMPPQMMHQLKLKRKNCCMEGHTLSLFTRSSNNYKAECRSCNMTAYSRNYCPTCYQYYCIDCRPVICSQTQPPMNDDYIKQTISIQIQDSSCDLCGTRPRFGKHNIYQDPLCMVSICDYCFDRLPTSLPKPPPYSPDSKCPKYHQLTRSSQTQPSKCGICTLSKESIKKCNYCRQHYCLECKKQEVFWGKCNLQHQFVKMGWNQKTEIQPYCAHCSIDIPLQSKFYKDEECRIILCIQCFELQRIKEMNRNNIRGRQNCNQCKIDKHLMCLVGVQSRVIKQCVSCQRYLSVKYICPKNIMEPDNKKKYICFQCDPQGLRHFQCALRHALRTIQGKTLKFCNSCQTMSYLGVTCRDCEYSICTPCYQLDPV